MPRSVSNMVMASDRLIEGLLAGLLDALPEVSLACLHRIDPIDRHSVVRQPCCAVANSSGRLRRPGDMLRQIRSSLDCDALLPLLREGRCAFVRVDTRRDAPTRRPRSPGAFRVLVGPAANRRDNLVGVVLVAWDDAGEPPGGADAADLMAAVTRVGGQIAAVIDLCALAAAGQRRKAA